ncbi:hypothetical protein ACLB2K_008496 [Fragaria x ananassa]
MLKLNFIFLLFPSILTLLLPTCDGRVFSFEMHHRYSDPVKQWSEVAGKLSPAATNLLPEKGSFEYYAELANHDRLLRGRKLVESSDTLAFSDGNSTFQITSLGYLHYTTVQLGTPGMKFMVALDTGSDLFWVPCEGTAYAPNFEVSKYDPKGSSTSKIVRCNNRLCMQRNKCLGASNTCPYRVSYVSDQTSTSGILVEDVLHLTTEDSHHEYVEAYITFGCGQVQSGSFLDIAAPNGLFGLGMEKISVPSILSREGFTADSFSMCFGHDGVGRINFGDKGSPDQEETPFNYDPSHPTYNISVTQIRVGADIMDIDLTALFDSGTSFTYLDDPTYTRISESFNSQARDKRRPPDSRIPFKYCYDMSPDANASWISGVSLTMKGGSQFEVYNPIIVISAGSGLVYCLAVVKSLELNIIGHIDPSTENFMTGYHVVFDREKKVLGWKNLDCYDTEDHHTYLPFKPRSYSVPPFAHGLRNRSISESAKNTSSNSASSVAYYNHTSLLTCFLFTILLFLSP